jgi:DNA repair protein RadC
MKVYDPTPRHQSTSTARDSEISQTPTARPRAVYVPHFRVSLVRDGSTRTESRHVHLPADGADILRACMPEDTDREVFGVLMLDVRPKVTGFHVVSVGSLTSSIIHPREVFTAAVLSKASALLLCHNHPSGDPEPSAEDIASNAASRRCRPARPRACFARRNTGSLRWLPEAPRGGS